MLGTIVGWISFLSTPSARRATKLAAIVAGDGSISIHALREEGDTRSQPKGTTRNAFLSTPSARRATPPTLRTVKILSNFYPRPPRGGRPKICISGNRYLYFYPRPPRGGRPGAAGCGAVSINFYPRPPRGGRRRVPIRPRTPMRNFYPRPPRGGRLPRLRTRASLSWYFYPRPPRGGRPALLRQVRREQAISIHALREEGD